MIKLVSISESSSYQDFFLPYSIALPEQFPPAPIYLLFPMWWIILFPSFLLSTVSFLPLVFISWNFVAVTLISEYPWWTSVPALRGLPASRHGLSLHNLVFLGVTPVKQSNPLIYTQIEKIFLSMDSWLQSVQCQTATLFSLGKK